MLTNSVDKLLQMDDEEFNKFKETVEVGSKKNLLYLYEGEVRIGELVVEPRWTAHTYAVNKTKARSNFEFQYRKKHKKQTRNKVINLTGRIYVEI